MVFQLISSRIRPPAVVEGGQSTVPAVSASYQVIVARSEEELAPYREQWDDLARHALEPNAFYESWMLLPALRGFAGEDVQMALVLAASDRGEPVLCGLFPLQRRWGYRGLPVAYLSLWEYAYCFSCVPLLRASCARECLRAFLGWLASDPQGAPLLEWPCVPQEGPLQQLLVDLCREQSLLWHAPELWTRAILRPREDAESYLKEALSSRQRKELRRKENRLGELGLVEYRSLPPGGDVASWIELFLHLEASGWKGREGTAMAARGADADYFRTVAQEAHRRGQLQVLGLFLAGRPIAIKCNLLSGNGVFAFKIAFDEELSRVSPGYQLEVAMIRQFHQQTAQRWVDSCTSCEPSLFDDLWLDRRIMGTLLLSSGRTPGDLVVSLLPLLRWLRRQLPFSRRRPSPPLKPATCSARREGEETACR